MHLGPGTHPRKLVLPFTRTFGWLPWSRGHSTVRCGSRQNSHTCARRRAIIRTTTCVAIELETDLFTSWCGPISAIASSQWAAHHVLVASSWDPSVTWICSVRPLRWITIICNLVFQLLQKSRSWEDSRITVFHGRPWNVCRKLRIRIVKQSLPSLLRFPMLSSTLVSANAHKCQLSWKRFYACTKCRRIPI